MVIFTRFNLANRLGASQLVTWRLMRLILEYDLHAPILCYVVTQWLMRFLLFPIAKEIDLYSTL